MYNGVINVFKEKGLTSFQVVAKIRTLFKGAKTGHTGTLDPMAEGVLPICIGNATRFAELLTAEDKQYVANIAFGKSYDSYDTTGTETANSNYIPSKEEIESVINSFIGSHNYTVPAFSAKKINGERAYKLARKGEIANAGEALMTVSSITLDSYEYPNATITVDCKKGTYIRSLIHAIGERTGAKAAMSGLVRTKNGIFTVEKSMTIDQIANMVKLDGFDNLLTLVQDCINLPKAIVNSNAIDRLKNGISPKLSEYLVIPDIKEKGLVFILSQDNDLLALGEYENNSIKLQKVFKS